MKTLFVMTYDCGDGSYTTKFTFNAEWVKQLEKKIENGELEEWDMESWCDGEGFHYRTLNLPDECTLESLGVIDCAEY